MPGRHHASLTRSFWTAALLAGAAACADSSSPDATTDGAVFPPSGSGDASTGPLPGYDAGVFTPAADASVGRADASVGAPDGATGSADAAAGSDAATGTDAAAPNGDASVPPASDLCHVPGKEIAVLGDSYVALSYNQPIPGDSFPFVTELQKLARAAGALGPSEEYRKYAVSGAAMAPGPLALIRPIPLQLDDALAAGKTTVVLMDGGGNDVLVDNRGCLNFTSVAEVAANKDCTAVVDRALEASQKMFDKGVAAGVKAVVFFFYPHLPKDSLGGGAGPNYVLDYAYPRVKQFCESQSKAKCHFVDMRKGFDDGTWTGKDDGSGYPREGLIEFDGIHPTAEGSKILASEFWKVMQASCVAAK
jgi:lysophospholipase L1-like esterase